MPSVDVIQLKAMPRLLVLGRVTFRPVRVTTNTPLPVVVTGPRSNDSGAPTGLENTGSVAAPAPLYAPQNCRRKRTPATLWAPTTNNPALASVIVGVAP